MVKGVRGFRLFLCLRRVHLSGFMGGSSPERAAFIVLESGRADEIHVHGGGLVLSGKFLLDDDDDDEDADAEHEDDAFLPKLSFKPEVFFIFGMFIDD